MAYTLGNANNRLSVVICTYNPSKFYLEETIRSLRQQTIPPTNWELILVDNASSHRTSDWLNLSWHPFHRFVDEKTLGLHYARLKGIAESKGQLIVFVDDDNSLDPFYLENALLIESQFPFLGAWGAGEIIAKYPRTPPKWLLRYENRWAVSLPGDMWSNFIFCYESVPWGCGLCLRRNIAEAWVKTKSKEERPFILDRCGEIPNFGGDIDMALTACDLGLGTGRFRSLKLSHLIHEERMHEEYIIKDAEGRSYSSVILESLRGRFLKPSDLRKNFFQNFGDKLRLLRMDRRSRLERLAWDRGRVRASLDLEVWAKGGKRKEETLSCSNGAQSPENKIVSNSAK